MEQREFCGNIERCDDFPFCKAHEGTTTQERNNELWNEVVGTIQRKAAVKAEREENGK